jgi:PPK2 family polyphosphate:nucleotide phosphotransferase
MRNGIRIEPGTTVDLAGLPADARLGLKDRDEAEEREAALAVELEELGTKLAADGRFALLAVFQGMDAAGKDGAIKRCIGPLNPMMTETTAFKAPTAEELAHDFLWRIHLRCPERGRVGAFNRSHYEDILFPRVEQKSPRKTWEHRYEQINAFERQLVREGTVVLKFFLHVSREEQGKRFAERIADPRKRWKFDPADLDKRARWDDYMEAYREILERTSTDWAPWHVIPGDRKWVRNVVVTEVVLEALQSLGLEWPDIDPAVAKLLIV